MIEITREEYDNGIYGIANYFWNVLQQEGYLDLAFIQVEPADIESFFALSIKNDDGDIIDKDCGFFTNLDEFAKCIDELGLTMFLIDELQYCYTAVDYKELQQRHNKLWVKHEELKKKHRALKKQHKEFQDSNGFNQKIDNMYDYANKLMNCIAKLKQGGKK